MFSFYETSVERSVVYWGKQFCEQTREERPWLPLV